MTPEALETVDAAIKRLEESLETMKDIRPSNRDAAELANRVIRVVEYLEKLKLNANSTTK